MFTSSLTTTAAAVVSDGRNPFTGVAPNFTIFGVTFHNKLQALLAGVWALCLIACAFALLVSGVKIGYAKRQSHDADDLSRATGHFRMALLALAGVAGAGIIFGGVLAFIG